MNRRERPTSAPPNLRASQTDNSAIFDPLTGRDSPSKDRPISGNFRSSCLAAAAIALTAGCGRAAAQQESQPKPQRFENNALSVVPLAGQQVPLLPITMVVADTSVERDSAWAPWRGRAAALARGDSLITDELTMRGPEIGWVPPNELRKLARRAPGMLSDPGSMGQAMLRAPKLERIPDGLASSLRKLVAMAGGRMVFVPAALGFSRAADGRVRADLALVLVDTRRNTVAWRSQAVGHGADPDEALRAALTTVFPQ